VRTHLDLLQAQQALTSVEKEVSQTRYRFLLARLQLAQAAGVLDEQTLQSLSERAPAMP
jgi:outer membrane protein